MKKDYIPKRQNDLIAWMENFKTNFQPIASSISYTEAEINPIVTLIDELLGAYNNQQQMKMSMAGINQEFDEQRKRTEDGMRKFVQHIKNDVSFTDAMAAQLGIIGVEVEENFADLMPDLELKKDGQALLIKFTKGTTAGARIYCKRGDEVSFSLIGQAIKSVYQDKRPNLVEGKPEKREYYIYLIDTDGEEIGSSSAVYSVVL